MNLKALLEPGSVAVLGASTRPSVGGDMVETLKRFGYQGEIYPVNPKYQSLLDLPCYPSLRDLPSPLARAGRGRAATGSASSPARAAWRS